MMLPFLRLYEFYNIKVEDGFVSCITTLIKITDRDFFVCGLSFIYLDDTEPTNNRTCLTPAVIDVSKSKFCSYHVNSEFENAINLKLLYFKKMSVVTSYFWHGASREDCHNLFWTSFCILKKVFMVVIILGFDV